LVGIPDPHRQLHEYMDEKDIGLLNLSLFTRSIWISFIVLFYLFELFMLNIFN
jgi:hypothetical protein